MITLKVDEGYAYDFLSILEIKKNKKICDKKNYQNYFNEIKDQVGSSLHKKIIKSKHYKKCISINKKIFAAVDLAKNDKILASRVQDLNYDRFLAKIDLQKKWFPQSTLIEKKN